MIFFFHLKWCRHFWDAYSHLHEIKPSHVIFWDGFINFVLKMLTQLRDAQFFFFFKEKCCIVTLFCCIVVIACSVKDNQATCVKKLLNFITHWYASIFCKKNLSILRKCAIYLQQKNRLIIADLAHSFSSFSPHHSDECKTKYT